MSGLSLLLLLLCAATRAASQVCLPALRSLSRQRNEWPTLCDVSGCLPWWSSALPRAGLAALWPDSLRPLLEKLNAGQPLTLLALGSSIVEGGAGCYATPEAVHAAGIASAPPGMNRSLASAGCPRYGFLSELLAVVNATWPHAGHLLVNAGRGGASLHSFATHTCVDPWIPTSVDLLLFENHEVLRTAAASEELVGDVESLFHHVLSLLPPGSAPPPLVVLNVLPLSDSAGAAEPGSSCVAAGGGACGTCGEENAARLVDRVTRSSGAAEGALTTACRRYGWTSLSLKDAVAAGLRDGLHTVLGWTPCEWVHAWMRDRVHPSALGIRLIAHMLLEALLSAQDAAAAVACEGPASVPFVARMPKVPFRAGAFAQMLRLCNDGAQLAVTINDGWHYAASELIKGRQVYKAGWIANASGAVLQFTVHTRVPTLPADAQPLLRLQFLTSYEHMGAAELRCVSGCACAPERLEAHLEERVSVEHAGGGRVTQSAACELRLTVLPETRSGEHKFKLLGLSVVAQEDYAQRR